MRGHRGQYADTRRPSAREAFYGRNHSKDPLPDPWDGEMAVRTEDTRRGRCPPKAGFPARDTPWRFLSNQRYFPNNRERSDIRRWEARTTMKSVAASRPPLRDSRSASLPLGDRATPRPDPTVPPRS